MTAGPGDRIVALRIEGWFRGALTASAPTTFGPVSIHATDYDQRRTTFTIAPQAADVAWDDLPQIDALVSTLLTQLRAALVVTWRTGIEILTWTHVDALVNGAWLGRGTGMTATGSTSADVVHTPRTADPAEVWDAAARLSGDHVELLNLGGLAASLLPNGHVAGVPPTATVIEAHLRVGAPLTEGDRLADQLRARGWPISPNPSRPLPRIRASVAHPTPKDPLPSHQEFVWTREVATAAMLDHAGVAPDRPIGVP